MKSLALAIMIMSSGCFTTWAGMQAGGHSLAWDEQLRMESVPQPAIDERLAISMQLPPAMSSSQGGAAQDLPAQGGIKLQCNSAQNARETVYRSSFRYGRGWKKATAIAFALEAATAGLFAIGGRNDPKTYIYTGLIAADAVGTAALFFVPRKEKFTQTERNVLTPVREDCPEGLMIEIAGSSFAVDAAGHIGDAGELALEDWMKDRSGAVLVSYAGRTAELRVPTAVPPGVTAGVVYTYLSVPLGTLTAIAE